MPDGGQFPYYIIPFDRDGQCEGPQTQEHLVEAAADYTDLFLFSHGWNNDWTAATQRYEDFIRGVQALRQKFRLPSPPPYRPLLAGIFWPSEALSWFESETGPKIAAGDPAAQDESATALSRTLRDIAADLPTSERPGFYRWIGSEKLTGNDAGMLADVLAGILASDSEDGIARQPTAADLLAAAAALQEPEPDLDAISPLPLASAQPQAAAGLGSIVSALDPRNLVKPFTVWRMKDRAGRVGAGGVKTLLHDLLARSQARIHLLGHSFGCKVVMTALSRLENPARPVESALLLQPAVSKYAFAGQVPRRGVSGGFHRALERVRLPILSTFSSHDVALSKVFHLAVRRHDDVGELQMAGEGSEFGALGGYGPQPPQCPPVFINDPGQPYDLQVPARIIGVNGSRTIRGHGDVSNESTWWASYWLATAHSRA